MQRNTSTTRSRFVPAVTAGVLATCLGAVAGAPAAHADGGVGISSDFNGDGYEDLAIGSPYQAVRGKADAGTVTVSYGGFGGVSAGGTQLWHGDSPQLDGSASDHEFFGTALAAADFDGDGYADLAVGVPGNGSGATGAGSVVVLKGGPGGLTATGSREYRQGAGVPGTAGTSEDFGWALAAGDFDRDGRADLAVGAPGDTSGGIRGGSVSVLRGVDEWNGNSTVLEPDSVWTDGQVGQGFPANGSQFGRAVATGDVTGNGFDDLVAGSPGTQRITLLHGGEDGITSVNGRTVTPTDLPGGAPRPSFGVTLAVGRFVGSHHEDVAIGAPQASVVSEPGAGVVTVLRGDAWGVDTTRPQVLVEGAVPGGDMRARDGFGSALVAGSFGHGGEEDLVIGSEGQDVDLGRDAGAAYVFYGGAESFYEADRTVLSSTADGYRNAGNTNDWFGTSLGRADLNGDGRDEVLVGAPGDRVGGLQAAGSVEVFAGQDGAVSNSHARTTWHQGLFPNVANALNSPSVHYGRGLSR
ncbi:FG-GAP and VCBS repeat-containing protein [Kineococcus aurantiacus]|uniref:FG-GAP repeat protein n=1 Tax=Kineococcus aurantiacus TaxID=37633 RepID=A0A7Y9AVY3_9ACTN|nr:FG-GAP and VCBS repeat-containing protein [Kineococcus aurantiacus]NYD21795.1 hypothetical protein [Kineococcus aurantiacus]